MWSEKVNSPHLRGTPNWAGGQGAGKGVKEREVGRGAAGIRSYFALFYVSRSRETTCFEIRENFWMKEET